MVTVDYDSHGAIWRVQGQVPGEPLVPALASGPLDGLRVAVKDLFAVKGHRIGAGSRAYLEQSHIEPEHAPAVRTLLEAGASVTGIAQTDQFAYSIAGLNPDYGTPPNPAVPGGIPGGSSSGPASAVALGLVEIGLGTDTAGSIRVPASYQGLWGLRTSHGAIALEGVLPLAPRYDTVGWLTRDGRTMHAVAHAQGLAGRWRPSKVVLAPGLAAAALPEARAAFGEAIERIRAAVASLDAVDEWRGERSWEHVELPGAAESFAAFRVTQSAQAWRSHGQWVRANPGVLAPDIAERFAFASTVTREQEADADAVVGRYRARIDAALGDALLIVPSAASPAPPADASAGYLQAVREATLGMTAVAGFTGRPALSVPWASTSAGPLGLSLIGPRGSDASLIELALRWEEAC